jgi:hypothetical protein
VAAAELVLDVKLRQWNRLYSTGRMLDYLLARDKNTMAKLRARARMAGAPVPMRVTAEHAAKFLSGEIEEMAFEAKLAEADRLLHNPFRLGVWLSRRNRIAALKHCGRYGAKRHFLREVRGAV